MFSILVDFAYSMLLRGNGRYELDEPVVGTSYESVSSLFYLFDTLLLTNIVSINIYLSTLSSSILILHASFDITTDPLLVS